MREFADRDFLETLEGLMFCVIGNIHPPDRVIAYLKYVPGYDAGHRVKWSKRGTLYGRILPYYSAEGVGRVMEFLEKMYPDYITYDRVLGFKLIEVPKNKIKKHYRPEERLAEILRSPADLLEEEVIEIVSILSEKSGVPPTSMGISGSILLKIHNVEFSDIDLIVYGRRESLKVKDALLELYSDPKSGFEMASGSILEKWAENIVKIHPLTLSEARMLYGRDKWNRALFRGRQFSVHPVKREDEVTENYGDRVFRGIGMVKAVARVVDSSDSIFLPATYLVDYVKVVEGPSSRNIVEVTSYEGLYCDLASPGEKILVYGKLEHVRDIRRGEEYHRIVVGSFEAGGRDYIKPLRWIKGS